MCVRHLDRKKWFGRKIGPILHFCFHFLAYLHHTSTQINIKYFNIFIIQTSFSLCMRVFIWSELFFLFASGKLERKFIPLPFPRIIKIRSVEMMGKMIKKITSYLCVVLRSNTWKNMQHTKSNVKWRLLAFWLQ